MPLTMLPSETDSRVASPIGERLLAFSLNQFDVTGRALGINLAGLYAGIQNASRALQLICAALKLGRARLGLHAALISNQLGHHGRYLNLHRKADVALIALRSLSQTAADQDERSALKRIQRLLLLERLTGRTHLLSQEGGLYALRLQIGALREACAALPWHRVEEADIKSALSVLANPKLLMQSEIRYRDLHAWERLHDAWEILCLECDWSSLGQTDRTAEEMTLSLVELDRAMKLLQTERGLRQLRTMIQSIPSIPSSERTRALTLIRRQMIEYHRPRANPEYPTALARL